jgi:hypothetical protein
MIKEKVWKDLKLTLKGSQWEPQPNLTAGVLSVVCWVFKEKGRESNEFWGPLRGTEYQWDVQDHQGAKNQLESQFPFIIGSQNRSRSTKALGRVTCWDPGSSHSCVSLPHFI